MKTFHLLMPGGINCNNFEKTCQKTLKVDFPRFLDDLAFSNPADRVRLGSALLFRGQAGCPVPEAGRSGGFSLVSADFSSVLQAFGARQDCGVPALCEYRSRSRWLPLTSLALGTFLQEQWQCFRLCLALVMKSCLSHYLNNCVPPTLFGKARNDGRNLWKVLLF